MSFMQISSLLSFSKYAKFSYSHFFDTACSFHSRLSCISQYFYIPGCAGWRHRSYSHMLPYSPNSRAQALSPQDSQHTRSFYRWEKGMFQEPLWICYDICIYFCSPVENCFEISWVLCFSCNAYFLFICFFSLKHRTCMQLMISCVCGLFFNTGVSYLKISLAFRC